MTSCEPVLILGAARSGTKFLRDTLAVAPRIAAVPYDINYIWRRGNEAVEHDELDPRDCELGYSANIRRDVVRQALRRREPIHTVLEKTVSNTLRVPFLECVVKGGKYICLIRDGRDVVESSYRCWQQPPDYRYLLQKARTFPLNDWRYALRFVRGLFSWSNSGRSQRTWGPVYRGMYGDLLSEPLEVVVARQWRRCVESSLANLQKIPQERVFFIRYEDMVAGAEWVPPLMDFLGVEDGISAVIEQYRSSVRRGEDNRWLWTFSDVQRERIWSEIAGTMGKLGYA